MPLKLTELQRYGGSQGRKETQRGPGNHSRGGPITTPVCAEIEKLKASAEGVEREKTWGGVSPHHPSRGLGERRKVSQRGPGGAPAENGFYAYLRSERSHLEHPFQYFERWRGPQNVAGPEKTFPLPPSRRAWEQRSTAFLFQRLTVAIPRGKAASVTRTSQSAKTGRYFFICEGHSHHCLFTNFTYTTHVSDIS